MRSYLLPHNKEFAVRRTLALLAGSLALLSCSTSTSVALHALTHNKNIVYINITCEKDGVIAEVDNWEAKVAKADTNAIFRIKQGAHVATISITPKDSATWPFSDPLPYTVSSGADFTLKNKNGKSSGKPAGYTITATCKDPSGPSTHKVVIDPDMIVD